MWLCVLFLDASRNGTFIMSIFVGQKTAFFQVLVSMVLRIWEQEETSPSWH